eukprot:1175985-Prorocentrum_minimum.AAC.10
MCRTCYTCCLLCAPIPHLFLLYHYYYYCYAILRLLSSLHFSSPDHSNSWPKPTAISLQPRPESSRAELDYWSCIGGGLIGGAGVRRAYSVSTCVSTSRKKDPNAIACTRQYKSQSRQSAPTLNIPARLN